MLITNILFGFVISQTISLCDKYTTALFKNNTPDNQLILITLVVNTAIIGNYTNGSMNAVPGILGVDGDLLKFFDGSMATTNENNVPTKVNFLDDGGAAPLLLNKPSNGTNSRQYTLVTHLYEIFGSLLGCSQFKAYDGEMSMYDVHKFMKLNKTQMVYFIQQVGLSATSFGVTTEDATSVGNAMSSLFLMRCSAPVALTPGSPASLQAICNSEDCPIAQNAMCDSYSSSETTPPMSSPMPSPKPTTHSNSATAINSLSCLFFVIVLGM